MKANRLFWLGLILAALPVALILAPVGEAYFSYPGIFSQISRVLFRPLCHQRPERSFSMFGACFPVCVRCTGLYLGFFLGWLIWHFVPVRRRDVAVSNRTLVIGFFPLLLDGMINAVAPLVSPWPVRFFTGLLCGAVAGRSLWSALLEAGQTWRLSDMIRREAETGRMLEFSRRAREK